jgi:hypothetical protein
MLLYVTGYELVLFAEEMAVSLIMMDQSLAALIILGLSGSTITAI